MSPHVSTQTLIEVATAVLDQHHNFTEAELISYVQECYPEVPDQLQCPLVVGAAAGAQRATHVFPDGKEQMLAKREKAWYGG